MDFIEALLQQWCSVFVNSVAFGTEDLGGKRLAHELSVVGTEPVLVDMARRLRRRQVVRVLAEVLELVLVDGEVSNGAFKRDPHEFDGATAAQTYIPQSRECEKKVVRLGIERYRGFSSTSQSSRRKTSSENKVDSVQEKRTICPRLCLPRFCESPW